MMITEHAHGTFLVSFNEPEAAVLEWVATQAAVRKRAEIDDPQCADLLYEVLNSWLSVADVPADLNVQILSRPDTQ